MRAPVPLPLHGAYASLEPLNDRHAEDLLRVAGDPEVLHWLRMPRPQTLPDARDLVATALADPDRIPYAVVVDGICRGATSYLDVDLTVGGLEIGWTWYERSVWGTRVNPQCKRLLLGHAFDDLGAGRVYLKADSLNTRSCRAIARLGARHDGILRHHKPRQDGTVRDTAYYSILVSEWPAVRAGLDARLA